MKGSPSGSLIRIFQLKLKRFPVEPLDGAGVVMDGGLFVITDVVGPCWRMTDRMSVFVEGSMTEAWI